jgi:hypothetical protein
MPRKPLNPYLKYGNLAIQMGLIIGLFVWGGQKLDARYNAGSTPVWTIVLSLVGIAASLYIVIKDVLKPEK